MDDDGIVVAFTTTPDGDSAAAIARQLVEEGIVACASRIPEVVSIYRFEGAVHEDRENLLIMKTARPKLAELEARLMDLHPYDVPELVVVDASKVGAKYAEWLRSVVR
jgi:periplasmic divalent cation tolerance protein